MAGNGDLAFCARLNPRLGWLLVGVEVGEFVGDRSLRMAVSTLPSREDRYILRDLQIDGQPIPALEVGISRLASRAGVSGLLGLNFFRQFLELHVDLTDLRFTLIDP